MMDSSDSKVVSLQFDNSQFEEGVQESLSSIQKLNNSISTMGSSSSDLSGISSAVERISNHFTSLGIIGTTVLSNLTNSAVNLLKKATSQVVSGGITRALNIEQARFQMEGLGMDVEKIMGEGGPVQNAVKGTAYGLDEAAKAASMLGASGRTNLKTLEHDLTAISGAASMTGQDYSTVADIFTTVASNGKLMTQQVRQFSFAGLNVAALLAKRMNKTEAEINEMVTQGKISFDDFSDAMYDAFGTHAKEANKTFTGALANVKAALSRIGGDFFGGKDGVSGMFESLRYLMAGSKEDLENGRGLIAMIDSIRKVLQPLIFMIDNLTQSAAESLYNKINSITDKINSFYNAMYGKGPNGAVNIKSGPISDVITIFENLGTIINKISPLINIFARIFWTAFTTILHAISKFTDILANGNFISNAVNIITFAFNNLSIVLSKISVVMDKAIDKIANAFLYLKDVLTSTDTITKRTNFLADIFNAASLGLLGVTIGNFVKLIRGFFGQMKVWQRKISGMTHFEKAMKELQDTLVELENTLKSQQLITIAIAIGILAGSLYLISSIDPKALTRGIYAIEVLFVSLSATLYTLNLKSVDIKVMGLIAVMEGFSLAILILSAAVKNLSSLNFSELSVGLTGVLTMILAMVSVINYLSDMSVEIDNSKLALISMIMLSFAVSIKILSSSVKEIASLSIEGLIKGLAGVAALMFSISAAINYLSNSIPNKSNALQLISIGIAMIAFSSAVYILSDAVLKLSSLSWNKMEKGIVGIAAGMGIVVGAMTVLWKVMMKGFGLFSSASIITLSASMIGMSIAVDLLAEAFIKFSSVDPSKFGFGMAGMIGTMGSLIALIKIAKPLTMVLVAASMLKLSEAMFNFYIVIEKFSSLSVKNLVVGIVEIVGIMAAIAGVSTLLASSTIPMIAFGIALTVVGVGLSSLSLGLNGLLSVLATAYATFSNFSSMVASQIEAVISGFGVTGKLIGSFMAGLAKQIIEELPTLFDTIISSITSMASKLTDFVGKLATTILDAIDTYISPIVSKLLDVISKIIDSITGKIDTIVTSLTAFAIELVNRFADAINENKEAISAAFENIVLALVNVLGEILTKGPAIIKAMFSMLVNAIKTNINNCYAMMVKLVSRMLAALKTAPSKMKAVAVKAIKAYISGITGMIGSAASAAGKVVSRIVSALGKLKSKLVSVGKNAIKGFLNGLSSANIQSIASKLGSRFLNAIKKKLGIASPSKEMFKVAMYSMAGFVNGIKDNMRSVTNSAETIGDNTMSALSNALDFNGDGLSDINSNPVITPILDLSNVQAGLGALDSMFSTQYAIGLGSTMSMTPEDMINSIVTGVKDAVSSVLSTGNNNDDDGSDTYEINVPLYMDAREVAKATATYTKEELSKLSNRSNRKKGNA